MKFLTTNFVKCAVKSCDASEKSFPLKYEECQLQSEEQEFNPAFIVSMLDRIDWDALVSVAADLGNRSIPAEKPENIEQNEALLRELHSLLLETQIVEGKMMCQNCGHIYYIKDSIPNFLLPPHLAN
ncbi:DEKNAAC100774 [Brettanomyces naardenensis]|uniref:Multifunctional methyltransferase subunit trm112 n=1 Tax=Brettanomyces naardenensis TaxID=13370 RepID=A0A448YG19_BRENA|nr:DEKNAAC100774 [Brettanomyces naardenensis]